MQKISFVQIKVIYVMMITEELREQHMVGGTKTIN
jgi:hypothetical protein